MRDRLDWSCRSTCPEVECLSATGGFAARKKLLKSIPIFLQEAL